MPINPGLRFACPRLSADRRSAAHLRLSHSLFGAGAHHWQNQFRDAIDQATPAENRISSVLFLSGRVTGIPEVVSRFPVNTFSSCRS